MANLSRVEVFKPEIAFMQMEPRRLRFLKETDVFETEEC